MGIVFLLCSECARARLDSFCFFLVTIDPSASLPLYENCSRFYFRVIDWVVFFFLCFVSSSVCPRVCVCVSSRIEQDNKKKRPRGILTPAYMNI